MTRVDQQLLELRSRHLNAVQRLTGALYQTTDLASIRSLALDIALEVCDAEAGSILLVDESRRDLIFEEVRGPVASLLRHTSLSVASNSLVSQVYRTGISSIVNNAAGDPHHDSHVDESVGYRTQSLLTVPLRARAAQPLGVFQLVNKRRGDFDSDDAAILETMGSVVSISIEHARLASEAQVAAVARAIGEISHDIGNMLSGVLPYVQTIGSFIDDARGGDPAALAALSAFYAIALDEVTGGVGRIQSLARDISAAVKGEITAPDFAEAKVRDVVDQVLRSLAETARKQAVALDATGDGGLSALMDERRMHNALYNLVNNALAETKEGDRVTVDIASDADWYEITVTDTGRGMPESVRSVLFTDAVKTTKPNGTGLGTRIVRRTVEQHGGAVTVESEVGKGTTVRLRLPKNPV